MCRVLFCSWVMMQESLIFPFLYLAQDKLLMQCQLWLMWHKKKDLWSNHPYVYIPLHDRSWMQEVTQLNNFFFQTYKQTHRHPIHFIVTKFSTGKNLFLHNKTLLHWRALWSRECTTLKAKILSFLRLTFNHVSFCQRIDSVV